MHDGLPNVGRRKLLAVLALAPAPLVVPKAEPALRAPEESKADATRKVTVSQALAEFVNDAAERVRRKRGG